MLGTLRQHHIGGLPQFKQASSFEQSLVLSLPRSHFLRLCSMQESTSSTFTCGLKNWITLPSELMKNFAKFQGISLASLVLGSQRELLERRQAQSGWVLGPFTSTFSMIGKLALKFSFTKAVISSGEPLSWLKNWLQGKARTSNPLPFHFSCAFTISLQFSEVSPHLQATLTTMISFLFRRVLRSQSLPMISWTLKSKKLVPPLPASPSLPDLKMSFAIRPPIVKNIINLPPPRAWLYSILFLMESSDGFKRRTGMNGLAHAKSLAALEPEPSEARAKFGRIGTSSQGVLRSRKREQDFLRTMQEVGERKCTFYRMGFKSYEKKENRKVVGEVLGMDAHRMKGTIFLGELWSNRDSNRFLKENKIYMTKVKLIDRMQALKKTFKETEKDDSLNEINIDSCRSLDEPKNHPRTTFPTHHLTDKRKNGLAENLEMIQTGLKDLKKSAGARSLVNEVKYLERYRERLEKVERHYFLKMIELQ